MPEMFAFRDYKCFWGYSVICDECIPNKPWWIENKPIKNPPALGKKHLCELCGKEFVLENPSEESETV